MITRLIQLGKPFWQHSTDETKDPFVCVEEMERNKAINTENVIFFGVDGMNICLQVIEYSFE